jgi:lipoprotein-releasing system ATP-binding protein
LADEPTGNLDYHTAQQVFSVIKALNQQFASSLVFVTHDSTLASQADRVLRLIDGVLEPILPSTLYPPSLC